MIRRIWELGIGNWERLWHRTMVVGGKVTWSRHGTDMPNNATLQPAVRHKRAPMTLKLMNG